MKTISESYDIKQCDCVKIRVAMDRFVQFCMWPDYLTGECGHMRADSEIGPKLPC